MSVIFLITAAKQSQLREDFLARWGKTLGYTGMHILDASDPNILTLVQSLPDRSHQLISTNIPLKPRARANLVSSSNVYEKAADLLSSSREGSTVSPPGS